MKSRICIRCVSILLCIPMRIRLLMGQGWLIMKLSGGTMVPKDGLALPLDSLKHHLKRRSRRSLQQNSRPQHQMHSSRRKPHRSNQLRQLTSDPHRGNRLRQLSSDLHRRNLHHRSQERSLSQTSITEGGNSFRKCRRLSWVPGNHGSKV